MNTGWMSDRVGVGFERMGREAEADRRNGVVDLGLGLGMSSAVGVCWAPAVA